MSVYQHTWPIEDTSVPIALLLIDALDDLEAAVHDLGRTIVGFPHFTRTGGHLLADTTVTERSAPCPSPRPST